MRKAYIYLIAVLLVSTLSQLPCSGSPASDSTYVYYGYAPPCNVTRLDVVGINDSTRVEIYDLNEKTLLASTTVNRMSLYTFNVSERIGASRDLYFKVVADKPLAVCLSGVWKISFGVRLQVVNGWRGFETFYPSTDGGFSGKEFIFMTTHTIWGPTNVPFQVNVYSIWGVEDGHVTVYEADGRKVTEFDVTAGSIQKVSLNEGSVYRVVSTSRILILSLDSEAFTYVPSLTGGFVGRYFYCMDAPGWRGDKSSLVILAHEDAEVSVYDLGRPSWSIQLSGPDVKKSLRRGEFWHNTTMLAKTPLRIESTGDITVLIGTGGDWWGLYPASYMTNASAIMPQNIGDDISFIGAKAGRELRFYAPTKAVLFATRDCSIYLDGALVEVMRDEPLTVLSGVHVIQADAPIIVEVLGEGGWEGDAPSYSPDFPVVGYESWGSYLISAQGLEVTYPQPPNPIGIQQLLPFIAIGVTVPLVLIALLVWRRRVRGTK